MKILFTGGGSGGHFYPIIAVAQEVQKIVEERKLVDINFYYFADRPYSARTLFENNIEYIQIPAGKLRRYFSVKNFLDLFRTAWGIVVACWQMYLIYPDVVFSKGSYSSVPAVFAARFLRIPIIIHESDSHPGRANLWAGKFATKIAISYPEAAKYFREGKVALTGNPLRKEILHPTPRGVYEFLHLDPNLPTIFVLGGSQGSQKINDIIVDLLPTLLEKYQIIHQVGRANLAAIQNRTDYLLRDNILASRYKVFDYLGDTAIRMAAGIARLVISRAGSTIFEIAFWGLPSIIIPIPEEVSHDQTSNAYTYARTGAAVVLEENNLNDSVLKQEIDRILSTPAVWEEMHRATESFARPDASRLIAEELVNTALSHEK
jgi:UDP-N-acetylglucosamine--N-acetylmuramyl-(pentapeptide) pyrophosphoryl-undecaprenol N-acetylglucosamine transferase